MKKLLHIIIAAAIVTIPTAVMIKNHQQGFSVYIDKSQAQKILATPDSTYIIEIYDTTTPASRELIKMWDSADRLTSH